MCLRLKLQSHSQHDCTQSQERSVSDSLCTAGEQKEASRHIYRTKEEDSRGPTLGPHARNMQNVNKHGRKRAFQEIIPSSFKHCLIDAAAAA